MLKKLRSLLFDDSDAYQVGTLTYTPRTLAILFLWLFAGDACFVLMESVVPSILPLKFEHLGASNAVVGLILTTIPSIINAILNPIVSFKSDRYRSPLGRRIPFILYPLPFLVICLVATGYSDTLGLWIYHHLGGAAAGSSPRAVQIATIGVFMAAFAVFNAFLNAVFWYLFNDVVPERLLARFMSLFRLISMASTSVYNICIFQYADKHAPEITICVGILYFVVFGVMCLKVKEGRYPPPEQYVDGHSGVLSAIKTWAVECHGNSLYWFLYLMTVSTGLVWGTNVFMIYFYQSTGLSLAQIGQVIGCGTIVTGILVPVSGWLADRFHPIRIVLAGRLSTLIVFYPITLVWFFYHPGHSVAFWIWIVAVGIVQAIAQALNGVELPLLMRLLPHSRYGQFCSANAVWNMIGGISGGILGGAFLDLIKRHVAANHVYYYLPVWQITFYGVSCVFLGGLYWRWKQHGGDEAYVPPLVSGAELESIDEPSGATDVDAVEASDDPVGSASGAGGHL